METLQYRRRGGNLANSGTMGGTKNCPGRLRTVAKVLKGEGHYIQKNRLESTKGETRPEKKSEGIALVTKVKTRNNGAWVVNHSQVEKSTLSPE